MDFVLFVLQFNPYRLPQTMQVAPSRGSSRQRCCQCWWSTCWQQMCCSGSRLPCHWLAPMPTPPSPTVSSTLLLALLTSSGMVSCDGCRLWSHQALHDSVLQFQLGSKQLLTIQTSWSKIGHGGDIVKVITLQVLNIVQHIWNPNFWSHIAGCMNCHTVVNTSFFFFSSFSDHLFKSTAC